MIKLLKATANSIAFLYSGFVVTTFIGLGIIALAAIATVITGILGIFNLSFLK